MYNDGRSVASGDALSVVDERSEYDHQPESAPDEHEKIAHEETQLVSYSRILVALVLLCTAAIVSAATHATIASAEREDFEQQWSHYGEELIDVFQSNADKVAHRLRIFSTQISSSAHHNLVPWPFYSLPDFETFGRSLRELTQVSLLAVSPAVNDLDRVQWETYSVNSKGWIEESFAVLNQTDTVVGSIPGSIHGIDGTPDPTASNYYPLWQMSPPPTDSSSVNTNLLHHPTYRRLVDIVAVSRMPAISEVLDMAELFGTSAPAVGDPQSILLVPIFEQVDRPSSDIVGYVIAVMAWSILLENILLGDHGIMNVVLRESCGAEFTYRVNGPEVVLAGPGDSHNPAYNDMKRSTTFASIDRAAFPEVQDIEDQCDFVVDVYPTVELEEVSQSNLSVLFTIGVISVFLFTSLVFILYDRVVQRRQNQVLQVASKTSALLSSMFPKNVRDQLFGNEEAKRRKREEKVAEEKRNRVRFGRSTAFSATAEMRSFLPEESELVDSAPIADLFPSATVLFADIAGFTAWSSSREPSQVFILLETLYRAFDKIAKQRGVFKVETIGDCYVAVVGLPDPCEDHATVMARFARDCMDKMNDLVHKLEVTLGPDTGDLAMRMGLHSGPVTAGVLRGDRARFQLFGDTVNTASRMESTGIKNKMQVSQETADLIIASGKPHWVSPRKETIEAKGKGLLHTYWLQPKADPAGLASTNSDASVTQDVERREKTAPPTAMGSVLTPISTTHTAKVQRMIDWNCDLLMQLLLRVVSKRNMEHGRRPSRIRSMRNMEHKVGRSSTCLDEVTDVIHLPKFESAAYEFDPRSSVLSENVVGQLHNYVAIVASMYRGNPFHSFEHASHVTMSTVKLLSRIVAPKAGSSEINDEELHDHTYGITSDPLTQFAVVFSALIHDVDHRGVPNFVLNREDPALASVYRYKSVAEQNSIDVAWELLMDPGFEDLRKAIYTNETEMKRFRQLIVNTVIATDIFDAELNTTRKVRWDKAFAGQESFSDVSRAINRKATVVIEHLIQASDVSHTMQHWHVYQKWNERLYHEMYAAYILGRSDKDPTDGWYEGELKFFDHYIIPLAKKLKDCGVFGVSSDEYLNYAEKNRAEWELKGAELVVALRKKYSAKLAKKQLDSPGPRSLALIPTPQLRRSTSEQA